MKTIISAAVLAMSLGTAALAQQPAQTVAGPAEIFTRLPAGTTVTNFYKQSVYDPSDNKIAMSMTFWSTRKVVSRPWSSVSADFSAWAKDVAVPFGSLRAGEKNNKWYLVLNTNKEASKTAPGFIYDKTKMTWRPAAK
jgi:hypothetical protein